MDRNLSKSKRFGDDLLHLYEPYYNIVSFLKWFFLFNFLLVSFLKSYAIFGETNILDGVKVHGAHCQGLKKFSPPKKVADCGDDTRLSRVSIPFFFAAVNIYMIIMYIYRWNTYNLI